MQGEDRKMAKPRKPSRIKLEIIQAATELFLEHGFHKTTSKMVCERAEVGTGNLTFYYPTKEHILAVLVRMSCDFQWQVMEANEEEGKSPLLSYLLELTAMAAISEENEQMMELYSASYAHPLTLDIIRTNDVPKMKQAFGEYCKEWTEEQFEEAEAIVSGIEYATVVRTEHTVPLPVRIKGALNSIMLLFGVPEDIRKMKIEKVLSMDYRAIGRHFCEGFKKYALETTEHAIEEHIKNAKPRRY